MFLAMKSVTGVILAGSAQPTHVTPVTGKARSCRARTTLEVTDDAVVAHLRAARRARALLGGRASTKGRPRHVGACGALARRRRRRRPSRPRRRRTRAAASSSCFAGALPAPLPPRVARGARGAVEVVAATDLELHHGDGPEHRLGLALVRAASAPSGGGPHGVLRRLIRAVGGAPAACTVAGHLGQVLRPDRITGHVGGLGFVVVTVIHDLPVYTFEPDTHTHRHAHGSR